MRTTQTLILVLVASACTSAAGYVTETTAATTGTVAVYDLDLDATYELPGFGFVIDHPSGWGTAAFGTVSVLALDPDGVESSELGTGAVDTPIIFIEYASSGRAPGGLSDPTPADLVAYNIEFFEFAEPDERTDLTIGGAAAIAVRTTDGFDNHVSMVQGVLDGQPYYLRLTVPNAAELDAFLSTWTAMLASIRPVG